MEKKQKATMNKKKNTSMQNKKTRTSNKKPINKRQTGSNRINWKNIKENKTMVIISLIALVLIIYGVYKVVELIQNPTDTFTVEQGKIYQEESTTRIYY